MPVQICAYFLYGSSETKVSMYSAPVDGAVNVPVSPWYVRGLGLGKAGVIWSTVVSLCFLGVIARLETASEIRSSVRA